MFSSGHRGYSSQTMGPRPLYRNRLTGEMEHFNPPGQRSSGPTKLDTKGLFKGSLPKCTTSRIQNISGPLKTSEYYNPPKAPKVKSIPVGSVQPKVKTCSKVAQKADSFTKGSYEKEPGRLLTKEKCYSDSIRKPIKPQIKTRSYGSVENHSSTNVTGHKGTPQMRRKLPDPCVFRRESDRKKEVPISLPRPPLDLCVQGVSMNPTKLVII